MSAVIPPSLRTKVLKLASEPLLIYMCMDFRCCHSPNLFVVHFSLIHKPFGEYVQGKYLFEQDFFIPRDSITHA